MAARTPCQPRRTYSVLRHKATLICVGYVLQPCVCIRSFLALTHLVLAWQGPSSSRPRSAPFEANPSLPAAHSYQPPVFSKYASHDDSSAASTGATARAGDERGTRRPAAAATRDVAQLSDARIQSYSNIMQADVPNDVAADDVGSGLRGRPRAVEPSPPTASADNGPGDEQPPPSRRSGRSRPAIAPAGSSSCAPRSAAAAAARSLRLVPSLRSAPVGLRFRDFFPVRTAACTSVFCC